MKDSNVVNLNNLNQWEQQTSLKVSSLDDLKQKITVPTDHRETVEDLIEQNVDVFAKENTDSGKTSTIKISINTGNHPPIKLIPYKTPVAKYRIVDKALNDMLAANIIHPFRSPCSFPVVVVDKKDSTKRFCTDFRK